jgi:hypothetical protein
LQCKIIVTKEGTKILAQEANTQKRKLAEAAQIWLHNDAHTQKIWKRLIFQQIKNLEKNNKVHIVL